MTKVAKTNHREEGCEMKDAHFHFVAATNGEKPFVFGNIDSIVRMQDELWQNGYGTLLFEADLSKLQFQPNVTLYEDDRFVLQTMLPGDRRILGLQLMLLKFADGSVVHHIYSVSVGC
jgi:hypothetical protein